MCGICGIINFDGRPVSEGYIRKMMLAMKHRGPDDDGIYINDSYGLGFVRLSIIDLSASGHQPMKDQTGRFTIVFNGEVYNYIEIREELKKKGYSFLSASDTEVILNSYIEWGPSCLHMFNGMWAFAIYDNEEQTIFLARDRFGIKPLYYYSDSTRFLFASDIPPITEITDKKPEPDNKTVCSFLMYNRTDQTEHTFYQGIKKLQHGHSLLLKNGSYHIRKWYNLEDNLGKPFRTNDEYRELFSDSVRLQLRSDVPVGVCLSGGLDSSAIVSMLLRDHHREDLNTFSAVFGKDAKEDESEFIDQFKGSVYKMVYTTPTAESFLNDLPAFIKAHSEPIPTTSPYAQYKVMESAKNEVTVLLDGQGADEQLAGYHYFFGFYFKELLNDLKFKLFLKEIFYYSMNHKSLYALKTLAYFMLPRANKEFISGREKKYLRPDFVNNHSGRNEILDTLYESRTLNSSLFNHFEYKLEHLLKWEDRNSMWFSLESRVPFLDHRLVERTLAMPSESIIKNGTTKILLREAMNGYLPEKIRKRKSKFGFFTPGGDWLRDNRFRVLINDMLNSTEFRHNEYIDNSIAKKLYASHLSGDIDIPNDIWKWINMYYWLENFKA